MSYREEYEYLQIACSENGRCLSCERYGKCKLREKADFERREREKLKTTVWWQCRHKNVESECAVCSNYKQCVTERGLPFRLYALRNVVINIHKNGEVELLQYKRPFHYLEECADLDREDIDRQRMLKKVRDGVYEPVSDDFTISALQRSIRNAGKRSKDTFMGYAKNNDWEYFITVTHFYGHFYLYMFVTFYRNEKNMVSEESLMERRLRRLVHSRRGHTEHFYIVAVKNRIIVKAAGKIDFGRFLAGGDALFGGKQAFFGNIFFGADF